MFRKLYRLVQRLLSSWWNHDRIRASPRDGRLLRIQAGDLLTIGTAHVEVQSRNVRTEAGLRILRLDCRSDSGSAVMYVTISPDQCEQRVIWQESGYRREFDLDEIHVWSRNHRQ